VSRRIVLIEDDPDIAALVEEVLVERGHELDTLSELPDGVTDREARLVITDLVEMSAFDPDAARTWVARVRAAFPAARVVIVTAHAAAASAREPLGADAVLTKPFDIVALAATVESLLG
jgi:DNA-binding response OmpR family regulator